MKVYKLKSGSYNVRKTIGGTRYSFTFDHKPTKAEIEEEVKKRANVKEGKLTFRQAAAQYIAIKENTLSPASVREYVRMCDRLPAWFVDAEISKLGKFELQKLANELSASLSVKTVKDRHAFCVGVLRLFNPSLVVSTNFAQKPVNEPYIPSREDIQAVIEASRGTQYYLALKLAAYGLRREEICAVMVEDLDDEGFLYIHRAIVQDKNKNWVEKTTKTEKSTRTIYLDEELAEEIRALGSGRVFQGFPGTISDHLRRVQIKLGMERFSVHKMRHSFCSTLCEANVDEATVLKLGGWSTPSVMKTVYRHSQIEKERERLAAVSSVLKI